MSAKKSPLPLTLIFHKDYIAESAKLRYEPRGNDSQCFMGNQKDEVPKREKYMTKPSLLVSPSYCPTISSHTFKLISFAFFLHEKHKEFTLGRWSDEKQTPQKETLGANP